jgi:hypothetical protein
MNPRLLRPTASGFNPKSIAGLEVWLDGNDSSTFTLNSGTVSEWRDKSGNSRHFAQGTALRQPAVTTAAKNGKSAVAFTNDWMTGSATYNVGSVFVVWEQSTTQEGDGNASILGSRVASSNKVANSSLAFLLTMPFSLTPGWANPTVAVDPKPASASYRLNGAVAGASFTDFAVGVNIRTSPDRWQQMNATFSPVSGAKNWVFGADPFTASSRLMQNGHIGEFLCYSTQLSASEVLRVERYLVAKWGLQ